ncbi:Nif3-like dinuclear metal center hexameric protein [Agilicoccus flavus]|uniref:Nif3-like dinuclear metal center hexameric protein n=1 Tax=Agilicoccus flavus TaxID=2775968 RepID=UPI001CF679BC|nr:Nif3-like dinuclear metal center hexameric protein [Agilicoccus flavus]
MSAPESSDLLTDPPDLAQVLAHLRRFFPEESAQSWDRVGLVSGDPAQPVRRIHFAVDPTLAVIAEAGDAGADLLVTHHPLLMRGITSVVPTDAKGAAVTALVLADLALWTAHTNADVATPGVNTALARACGLDAATCTPLSDSEGQGLGLVGDLGESISLGDLARRLESELPHAPVGVRVAGPPRAPVRRIALLGGAGDSLFEQVRASGADVYVTSDLRHHPALEAREQARAAGGARPGDPPEQAGPPYLVDAGHWATEWLWLAQARDDLLAALGPAGTTVETHVSTLCTDPWTFVVGADGPEAVPGPDERGTR